MANDQTMAPVIIKRKKLIAADGHLGGAWKVAYVDFVTAMMAFFMLMWLLNATTEQQKKGIADYFSPTLAINRSSGGEDSSFVGDTVKLECELPFDATREELVIQTQTGNEVFRTNVDPEDHTLHWSGTQSNGANVEHGSYKATLVLYNENGIMQNAPVFSFQKLIEAVQGNGTATLSSESGETIAPQNVVALR